MAVCLLIQNVPIKAVPLSALSSSSSGVVFKWNTSGFGGLGISVLAFGTQVCGFKPDRNRWIFQGEKILSTPSFGEEVKPSVPCRRFTACKRSLNVTWKSGIFRQNSSAISHPCSSTFGC